jgi:hypothetical protein
LVWKKNQKQMLIDSILKNLDIPKVYLREVAGEEICEEIIDGQQRLTAIYEFVSDSFPLDSEMDDVQGCLVAGKYFSELDESIKDLFEDYKLTSVLLKDATQEDAQGMFIRLQNGTSLNPAEKRNAMPGNMTPFVRQLAQHPFFNSCKFNNKRFEYDSIAAQMVKVTLTGNPRVAVGSVVVKEMYHAYTEFDHRGKTARSIASTLDFLYKSFPEKTPELTKLTALTLFSVASYFRKHFDMNGYEKDFRDTFIAFENACREDRMKPREERGDMFINYQDAIAKSTMSQKSVSIRYMAIISFFLKHLRKPRPLDPQRSFTEEERLEIYRRDHSVCQLKIKCGGKQCGWGDWHADHVIPHNKGGQTSVDNGQVACPECNLAKGG